MYNSAAIQCKKENHNKTYILGLPRLLKRQIKSFTITDLVNALEIQITNKHTETFQRQGIKICNINFTHYHKSFNLSVLSMGLTLTHNLPSIYSQTLAQK